MVATRNVGVLIGSLRKASFTRRLADAMAKLAPETLKLATIEIGQLPFYDQDLDEEKRPPEAWQAFRAAAKAKDAILFATPEYNRSVPGVLKNAIDVGSRPYGQSVWDKKPAAIVSVSPGAIGAFGANHHLRQSLVFLNMPVLQQPEAYIGSAATLFAPDGSIANDGTRDFLKTFLARFSELIERSFG